jgi:hypothetical protein
MATQVEGRYWATAKHYRPRAPHGAGLRAWGVGVCIDLQCKDESHFKTTKRLPRRQVEMLEVLIGYPDYTYVTGLPTLRALACMGLAEQRRGFERQWRITHKGVACLKQNGHYPVYIDMASVRDPRAVKPAKKTVMQVCSRCEGTGVDPDMPDCRCDVCGGTLEEEVSVDLSAELLRASGLEAT